MNDARRNLIRILQNAYSGERTAAYAHRRHWRSLGKSSAERERIRQIEEEEWTHRREVGKWLAVLEAKPRKINEAVLWIMAEVWARRVTFPAGFSDVFRGQIRKRQC